MGRTEVRKAMMNSRCAAVALYRCSKIFRRKAKTLLTTEMLKLRREMILPGEIQLELWSGSAHNALTEGLLTSAHARKV